MIKNERLTCQKYTSPWLFCCFFAVLTVIGCGNKPSQNDAETRGKGVSATPKAAASEPSDASDARKKADTHISEATLALFGDLGKKPVTAPVNIDPLKKGNVVLLIYDALNAGHLSVYGYERQTSPFMQEFAKGGLTLTNHVSNSSWTRPSFTTIVTGVPKRVHGVEANGGWRLEPEIVTLAERFRRAGYRTAGFTGNPLTRGIWGYNQGYQTYEDTHTMDRGFPPDKWLTDRARDWLASVGDNPFFLKIFYTAPHAPYRPLASARHFVKELKNGEVVEYPFREYKEPLDPADHRMTVAAYDDEVRYFDHQLGELRKTLKKMGVADKTAIFITGDHGEMFGQHGCYTHAYHTWEEALRVPMVMYLPWSKTDGVMTQELTTHVDILPTLLDMVNIPNSKADQMTGKSMFRIIGDGKIEDRTHFTQYNAHGIQRQTVRKGRYKLVHVDRIYEAALERVNQLHEGIPHADPHDLPSLARSLKGEYYEVYDLIDDPAETTDLNKKMQSKPIYKELLDALSPEKEETEDDNQIDPEVLEALKNAGYLQ